MVVRVRLISLCLLVLAGCTLDPAELYFPVTPSYQSSNFLPNSSPGVITAGEWNDSEHWDFWLDLYAHNPDLVTAIREWRMDPIHRYPIAVNSANGDKITNVAVSLLDPSGNLHWEAYTNNHGQVDVWSNLFPSEFVGDSLIQVRFGGEVENYSTDNIPSPITLNSEAPTPEILQIMMVVDATGSMGDELEYLKVELEEVITQVANSSPSRILETGALVYRDVNDQDYTTKFQNFSRRVADTKRFLQDQYADGGGDTPEAVHTALNIAIEQGNWNPNARARILFLMLDAPPHTLEEVKVSLHESISSAARQGIRIVPIAATGTDRPTEFLMRIIALATHGTYVFITDENEEGSVTTERDVTVGTFETEYLNDLLVRLISEYAE